MIENVMRLKHHITLFERLWSVFVVVHSCKNVLIPFFFTPPPPFIPTPPHPTPTLPYPPHLAVGYAQVGVTAEISGVELLPDGRSLLETRGNRRFQVLERSIRNGTTY